MEARKTERDLSWRDLARQLDLNHTVFTRMSHGKGVEANTLVALVDWLGEPLDNFLVGAAPEAHDDRQETLTAIRTYLRADRSLSSESAEAIESVLRAAYEHLSSKEAAAEGPAPPERKPRQVKKRPSRSRSRASSRTSS